MLENARVKVVLRGPGEGFYLHGTSGGGIIDLGRQGGVDVVKEIQPLVELSVGDWDEIVIVESGDDAPAEIALRGRAAVVPLIAAAIAADALDVVIEHRYRLAADSDVLELQTMVWPGEGSEDPGPVTVGDGIFLGGRARAFLPGRGWAEEGVSAAEAIGVEAGDVGLALAYDGSPLQLVDIQGIRLARGSLVRVGDGVGATRRLAISPTMGEALAQVVADAYTDVVVTSDAQEIVATDAAGAPFTIARVVDGSAKLWLPDGIWTLTGSTALVGSSEPLTVTAPNDEAISIAMPPRATLAHDVTDPVRLTIWDAAGERSVHFGASVGVAPGSWRAAISRGLEHDAVIVDAELAAGDTTTINGPLARVLDTTGWISLDTHLHSEMSTDSVIPLDERLRAVAAEGVEVAISTDHDFLTDYQPIVDELELSPWLVPVIGVEASSFIWGHLNSWPLEVDEDVPAHGAPVWYQRSPGEVMTELRALGSPAIQINHPRNSSTGLFELIDFDRNTLMATRDPISMGLPPDATLLDLGFDAIEVCNEGGESFEEGFLDWLAFVAAGHPAAATGSSDSHGATAYAGKCRTYVYVGNDEVASLDIRAVNDAVRARRVTVAGGSFITATVGDALPGDMVTATGEVAVRVRVQAPPWSPVTELRVYEKTELILTIPLDPASTDVVRHDADVTLPLGTSDTAFVFRVENGESVILGGTNPSFTNPILVDVDGDGVFDP